MKLLFDRYDPSALEGFFAETGVLAALRGKGFDDFAVSIEATDPVLPHVLLHGCKEGARHLLLDACLRRISVAPAAESERLDLLLVHWVREEDPTTSFSAERPALPLQNHPGLGVLRRAFRVAVAIGRDLGADGIANCPKFFHDALIFHHSRLFLFLDGREQGSFEALERDLQSLPLAQASLAVAAWCVRDGAGSALHWRPAYQVFPLSSRLLEHFHSPAYAAAVDEAREQSRFRVDVAALAALGDSAAGWAVGAWPDRPGPDGPRGNPPDTPRGRSGNLS
jgi:hypothetical protein